MATYASGSIHFDGLTSDTNFSEMIDKLYSLESRYAKQLLRWKEDWNERAEAFKRLREDMTSYRTSLAKLNSIDKFYIKSSVSSKESVATATAGGNALDGSYALEVKQLATNAVWSLETGLNKKTDVVNDTGAVQTFTYEYKGKTQTLNVPVGTTLEGFINLINNQSENPGVRASIVQSSSGILLQLRGKDTGSAATLAVIESGLTSIPVDTQFRWKMTPNSATFDLPAGAAAGDFINDRAEAQTFHIQLNGKVHVITVGGPGVKPTYQDLADGINQAINPDGETGPRVPYAKIDGGKFVIEAPSYVQEVVFEGDLAGIMSGTYEKRDDVVYTGVGEEMFFTVGGERKSIIVAKDAKLEDVCASINEQVKDLVALDSSAGVTVKVKEPIMEPTLTVLEEGTLSEMVYTQPTSDLWLVQESQNAQLRVNGWPREPQWLETDSNTVKDAAEGITFNLRSASTEPVIITVAVDVKGIEENITEFVDATNALRKTFIELTKVDKNKQTYDPEYADQQSERQMGSVLTGNYGVQLMSSRLKQAISGSGLGFTHYQKVGDSGVGDLFTSLSQVGITTNASEASENYGLLEIKTTKDNSGSLTLAEALAKDPRAVADLFAAKSEGISHSPYFGHNSHIPNLTKPGTYKVEYKTNEFGDIIWAEINGKEAKIDNENKTIGLFSNDIPRNPADGLYISVYDLTHTPGDTTMSGYINIRDGKINELLGMLDGEEGMLNKEKGALGILEKNYKEIMDNIDKKIQKEDARLEVWERRMRNRFANLEATLARYNGIKEGLEAQIKQLSASSK